MTDEVDRFLETLDETSPGRLPPPVHGTLRFELLRPGGNSHWLVTFAGGGATAVRERGPQTEPEADCTVTVSAHAFAHLLAGREQVISMLFRNCVSAKGDLSYFLHFRRLLPERTDGGSQAPSAQTRERSAQTRERSAQTRERSEPHRSEVPR